MKKILSLFCFFFFIFCVSGYAVETKNSNEMNAEKLHEKAKRQFESGNFDAAINTFTEAIKFNQNDAYLFSRRGKAKISKGDLKGALEDTNKALELKEESWFYVQRSTIKRALNDLKGAFEDINKALKLKSETGIRVAAYVERGDLKANSGDLDGAIKDYDEAAKISKEDWTFSIFARRGILKALKKDYDGAIKDYNKAIELKPEGWIYAQKADVYRLIGQKENALKYFKQALAIDPSLETAKQTIKELESN